MTLLMRTHKVSHSRLRYSYSRAFGKWHEYEYECNVQGRMREWQSSRYVVVFYMSALFFKLVLLLAAIHVWASWPVRARAPPCTSPCAGHTT
jgi:hypothetical protein